jgi:serine/threonine protein kinase
MKIGSGEGDPSDQRRASGDEVGGADGVSTVDASPSELPPRRRASADPLVDTSFVEDDFGVEHEPEQIVPGSLIADRFRIGRLIGRGGHGFVYEAEHVVLGYPVAIKVLHATYGLDARRRARFRREALLGARLRHRNIVSIHDAGELEDGSPYLVMEFVDGIDLGTVIDRARLDAAATVEIGEQLLAAVTALFERGVIHRDIKPTNVMLQRAVDGVVEVKLLDFGISKALRAEMALKTLTQDDCVLGTPQYMPPEQVKGETLDVRADLYSVGALLYECVTGVPPFDAETPGAVLAKILTQEIVPLAVMRPDLPRSLASVIDRAIRKDADERWRNPVEMAEALRGAAQRLGLPRGADAWASLSSERSQPMGTMPIDLVREKAVSTPPRAIERRGEETEKRALATRAERPISKSQSSLPAVEVASPWRLPVASPRNRWLAVAVAIPIAAAIGATTFGAAEPSAEASAAYPVVAAVAGPSTIGSVAGGSQAPSAPPVAAPRRAPGDTVVGASSGGSHPTPAPDPRGALAGSERAKAPPSASAGRPTTEPPPTELPPVTTPAPAERVDNGRAPSRASALDPGELERRARAAFLAGRVSEAVSVYQRATEIAPARASAWRGLGLASAASGDRRTAARALRRYLALAPQASDRPAIEQRLARLGP